MKFSEEIQKHVDDVKQIIQPIDSSSRAHGVFINCDYNNSVSPEGEDSAHVTISAAIWGDADDVERAIYSMCKNDAGFQSVILMVGQQLAMENMKGAIEEIRDSKK